MDQRMKSSGANKTCSKSWCSAPRSGRKLFRSSLVARQSVKAKGQDPGTQNKHFLGSRSVPLPAGARLSLASSTGCCQPQLSSKSSGAQVRSKPSSSPPYQLCLGSPGQSLISFQFKTKQALVYFLCFAFFHIYKRIFKIFFLLLPFITLLASSDSLPSNYLFFALASPDTAQVNRKVAGGTGATPALVGEGAGGDTGHEKGHRAQLHAHSQLPHSAGLSSIKNSEEINRSYKHSNLLSKIKTHRKVKTRSDVKDHPPTNFQNLAVKHYQQPSIL